MWRLLFVPLTAVVLLSGCDPRGAHTVVASAGESFGSAKQRDAVEARIVGLRAELDRAVQRAIAE